MKKLLLSALAICTFTFSNAQENSNESFEFFQGEIFVEGNLGVTSSNNKNTKTKANTFSFAPKAGYFISDKLAAGLNLIISSSKTEVNGITTTKVNGFGVRGFGRYYFLDLGKRFKTFAELGLGFSSDKVGVTNAVKNNIISLDAGLGLNYFVKDNIAITYGFSNILRFTSSKSDVSGAETITGFQFGLNNNSNFFANSQFGLLFKF